MVCLHLDVISSLKKTESTQTDQLTCQTLIAYQKSLKKIRHFKNE